MATGFGEIFHAWLAFLASLGFVAGAHLNPPATETAIVAVEAEIGFHLPDDLRELYLRADGQKPSFAIKDPAPGSIVTPFFGSYDFAPLSRALAEYRSWEEVIDAWPEGDDPNEFITLRAGDPPVARAYWRRGWFPFAIDGGGNAYAVDLSPPPGGTYGQVIVIGSDEDERRVVAPSVSAFMKRAAERRPKVHPDLESSPWRLFNMES
jgi:cell wall assembly regulator SMI1